MVARKLAQAAAAETTRIPRDPGVLRRAPRPLAPGGSRRARVEARGPARRARLDHGRHADRSPERDALLVVDMQHDFLPGGALAVADGDGSSRASRGSRPLSRPSSRRRTSIPRGHVSFAVRAPGREAVRDAAGSRRARRSSGPTTASRGTRRSGAPPRVPDAALTLVLRKGTRREVDSYSAFQRERRPRRPPAHHRPRRLAPRARRAARLRLRARARLLREVRARSTRAAEGFEVVVLDDLTRAVFPRRASDAELWTRRQLAARRRATGSPRVRGGRGAMSPRSSRGCVAASLHEARRPRRARADDADVNAHRLARSRSEVRLPAVSARPRTDRLLAVLARGARVRGLPRGQARRDRRRAARLGAAGVRRARHARAAPRRQGQPGWDERRATRCTREVEAFLGSRGDGQEARASASTPGSRRDAILAAAAGGGADLIVMGTHGRTGLSRLLLGASPRRCCAARVPVLTLVAADEARRAGAPCRSSARGGGATQGVRRAPQRRRKSRRSERAITRVSVRHGA